jgi:5'-nucleotidase
MQKILLTTLVIVFAVACAPTGTAPETDTVVISVIGTNDVHGELLAQPDRGGITTFSGYVAAIRNARANDGDVLLVDAGDMWQGTLESNLTEGSAVIDAYNALGYAAAAIGNHEFDFGPEGPKAIPESDSDDPQGALRKNASALQFPLLAANIIDTSTGRIVDWENVHASTLVTRRGVKIGIVGVITEDALFTTIAANTVGVQVVPLAESIVVEARKLRAAGAALVVVLAHGGSRCEEFDDPYDTSSCTLSGEIVRVANEIPHGLIDHIVAGHVHRGMAHVFNGIPITSGFSNARAFDRVDFTIDRNSGRIVNREIFPPQMICAKEHDEGEWCKDGESRGPASYEGVHIEPMPAVAAIAARASELVAQRKAEEVGVYLETPITLRDQPETALGNLLTDAMLESTDADIAIHNIYGGIRAEMPQGEVTFGHIFNVFPFDNRVSTVELTGLDVRKIMANQVHNERRRAGFSGMRTFVSCDAGRMSVQLIRNDGSEIQDSDILQVVTNDFLLLGGDNILTPVMPEGGFEIPRDTPLVRDTLVEWFSSRGGRMTAAEFRDPENLRWNLPDPLPEDCTFSER